MLKTADQLRNLLNNNRHILLKIYPKQKGKGTINYVYVTLYLILGHPVYIAHIYCIFNGESFHNVCCRLNRNMYNVFDQRFTK